MDQMIKKNPEKSLAARTGIVRQRQAASRKPQSVANAEPTGRRSALKVPEALPVEQRVKESPLKKFTSAVFRKKVTIQEIVREPTSGGIVFRLTADKKDIEVLLIQDSKGRWTIPKGHIEPGETAKMTARREIEEETGLKNFNVLAWLGKIHLKYRRADKLVLMTTQIYLVQALDAREELLGEKWMRGIRWFPFAEALDLIEYEDIEKLMLIAKRKIRSGEI
jgi:8-oxo-dGTP pyrophosphatase MutT (NUDIX family)